MKAIFADHCHETSNDPSAAGIRGQIKSDSLPYIYEEAEVNKRYEDIMSMLRTASNDNKGPTRGTPSGGHRVDSLRCCFALFMTAPMHGRATDRSRRTILRRKATISNEEWLKMEANIGRTLNKQTGAAIRKHVITNARQVLESIAVVRGALSKYKIDMRDIDQVSAIMGPGFWARDMAVPDVNSEVFKREIEVLATHMDVQSTEDTPDAEHLLDILLSQDVSFFDGKHNQNMKIRRMIYRSAADSMYADRLQELGFKYDPQREMLFIATQSETVRRLLRNTDFEGGLAKEILMQIDGATYKQNPVRLSSGQRARGVIVPYRIKE